MRQSQPRRTPLFAAALAALIAGAIALALGAHGEGAGEGSRSEATPLRRSIARSAPRWRHRVEGERGGGAASVAAAGFLRAYLRYEVGSQAGGERAALSRFATRRLAEELLGAPVRVPPGARAPRERLLGIAAERPSVIGGTGGMRVCAIVVRNGRRARLCVGVLDRGGRWAVAQVGL